MLKKIKDIMSKKENTSVKDKAEKTEEELINEEQENAGNAVDTEDTVDEQEETRIQLAELKDKYLRLFAEFDNYKKRTIKEKIDFMSTAAQDTMSALLPVLDDFDRAKKNAEDESSTEPFSEGVNLVYNKIYNVLQQKGLRAMETNGEAFDPELHEAITEIPAPSEEMKGKIIDTVEKGYFLKDKIIRHAKVVVGK